MKHILEVKQLNFEYYDTDVLRNVSFTLNKGDFLGIIGANGTGKSTLLKLILGLLPCRAGEIFLFGNDRTNFRDHSKLGYVSQKANSFNSDFPATVREVVTANLYSQLGLFHRPKKKHLDLCDRAIAAVGLTGCENRLIGNLSGGQQQRAFIARTLVNDPELIILDEPTVGIDATSVAAITKIITDLNKNGMTVIMTNHDTHSLVSLANKLLVLSEDGGASFYDKANMSDYKLKQLCSGLEGHHHA